MSNSLAELRQGMPPEDEGMLVRVTAGRDLWLDFLTERYLEQYIAFGGSKVKFILGKEGAGKTHYLRSLKAGAARRGYLTARVDAAAIKIQYFHQFYAAVLDSIDVDSWISGIGRWVAQQLCADGTPIVAGAAFWTQLQASVGVAEATRRRREVLVGLLENRRIHRSFAHAVVYLVLDQLGIRPLQVTDDRVVLLSWLRGQAANRPILKRYLIFTRIDRYNARAMLRSLLESVRYANLPGVFISIEHLEALVGSDPVTGRRRFSRIARDDTYESIRQLIDEVDSLPGLLCVASARPELIEDDQCGIKSYNALWLRMQNEVVVREFNRFADQVSLDRLLDPPSPISPEQIFLDAIFGEQSADDSYPSPEEERALLYLLEVHHRLTECFPDAVVWPSNPSNELLRGAALEVLRSKGPIAPVKRFVQKALELHVRTGP